jgi:transketolase
MNDISVLKNIAFKMRMRILELSVNAGKNGAHIGGSLSSVDLLTVLYSSILNLDFVNPQNKKRDRLILSKGHSALALFVALEEFGLIQKNELDTFEMNGSKYYCHASRDLSKGIEFSGGSLSLGLSFAVGVCLSNKIEKINNQVYVILGDGECDEGLVWESLMSANHLKLNNLTVIIDDNGLQSDGFSKDIMDKSSFLKMFEAFGFYTQEIDGHDINQILESFKRRNINMPNAIIAKTIKGKGVSFMENNKDWHHNILSRLQYELAIEELNDRNK